MRYIRGGEPTVDQCNLARQSSLYSEGDMVLIWANEGDLLEYGVCLDDVDDDNTSSEPDLIFPIECFPDSAPLAQPFSGGVFSQNSEPPIKYNKWVGAWCAITLASILLGWWAGHQ